MPRSRERLTLDDLKLKPEQEDILSKIDREPRQAILDACEHVRLTSYTQESRENAERFTEYFRKLTLGPTNKLPIDMTPADLAREKVKNNLKKQ